MKQRRLQPVAVFSNLLSKRIPTLLGLILLIAGLGTGLFLVGRATIIPRAAAGETPKEIKITNISENSFSVSWITDQATVGFVRYGAASGSLNQTVSDDRDQLSGSVGTYVTHHVTITRLRPETTYYFKLGSGTQRVLFDNGGQAYSVKTPAVLGTPPPADTVYGTVQAPAGGPAQGALVYLTLPNSTPLSALSKDEGNWAVSLSTARIRDLTQYVDYDRQATLVELFVQSGQGQTATAVTTTANDAPVPPITLGQTHDFRAGGGGAEDASLPPGAAVDEDSSQTQDTALAQSKFSLQSLGPAQEASSSFELEIINPELEGEQVASTRPEIFGTSPKNVTLTITVESTTPYTDTIEVGDDGFWQWSPPANLEPGEHTVTVSYTDQNGILQKLTRSFVVLAAEGDSSLPAFEATPSATASPSPAPSASPTATDSGRVSQPSTASGVPVAGNLTPTLAIFILGLGLFGVGVSWQLRLKT